MGSTLDPVLSAVLPVFGLVASGYLAGRFGLVSQASSAALNQFVYAFALPAMLFIAVYRGSLDEILSGYFLLAVILATLGTAAAGFLVSHFSRASPAQSTMRALNASFANTGYLGIPLVTVAYGERAALPAALATVATNIISFALAIVCLELFVNPQPGGVRRALSGVARSPLIWPIALAVLLVFLQVKIALPLERFAVLLAGAAGPCALFAIGLFVSQLSIRAGAAASWQSTVLKLALHPLLMAILAFWVLPIDPFWAKIAVVCAALPLGATAFVLAQRYKLLEAETSTGAVVSTAVSVLTVSLIMAFFAHGARADESAWKLAQAGGQVLFVRHATTTPGVGDPDGFRLEDCKTQRNLSEAGRAEAKRLGEALRLRKVPVGEVLSSPWCRCHDTAQLAFGTPGTRWTPLSNLFGRREAAEAQVRDLRARIGAYKGKDNLVMISHGSVALPLTGVSPQQAEIIVLTPLGGDRFRVAGRIPPPGSSP
jgi:predicted permease/phosphohistidine phosphatase SixA